MIIGTMRLEEARVFDSEAGYHRFVSQDGAEYGSFEVYWHDADAIGRNGYDDDDDDDAEPMRSGRYWKACFPGCMPDGDPSGPFARSSLAKDDALGD
jgi:hypothetical protein